MPLSETCRLLREREQAEELVRHVGGEEGRDLGVVVGGVDLYHVAADDLEAGEATHELLRLAAGEAPDLRRPRPWRVRGVDEVHVEGDVDLRLAGPLADTVYHPRYPELADLVRRDEVEAHLARVIPIPPVVDRTPHPGLDGARGIEETLFDGTPERRAVRVLLAEVGVPGVGMGIELHEGQRPMDRSGGPEFGQRYGVVAAKDNRGHPGPVDRPQTLLYPPVTLLDIARDDGDVAVVYDREVFEDRHVQARVVAPEEVGGAAYPLGTEAGPGPEGGARIERRAYYSDVRVRQVPRVRQAHEGTHVREARGLERVGWLVADQWFFISIRRSGGRLRLTVSAPSTKRASTPLLFACSTCSSKEAVRSVVRTSNRLPTWWKPGSWPVSLSKFRNRSIAYRIARLMSGVARICPTSPAAWEVVSSNRASLRSRTSTSVHPARARW